MPATYEPIATTTLGSAASTITFNSIANTWTDIRLVLMPIATGASSYNIKLNLNNDVATNYSWTHLTGDGSTASSNRLGSVAYTYLTYDGMRNSLLSFYTVDLFSYAGNTNKTMLIESSEDKNATGWVSRRVALYRSTSAVNRIDLTAVSTTFAAGTTATLYGIKAA